MALSVQQPTAGTLILRGALAVTPLPAGVTVAQPTDGELPILGAYVIGTVTGGAFQQGGY